MQIPRQFVESMVKHALADDPNECCGILSSKEGQVVNIFHMTNVEHSPYRYSMDSKELYLAYKEIEETDCELFAIYHSHTHSEAYPSSTDVRLASWPDAFYILISLLNKIDPIVRIFSIQDGSITEHSLENLNEDLLR